MDTSLLADAFVSVMRALSLACVGAGAGFSLAEALRGLPICAKRTGGGAAAGRSESRPEMIRVEARHTFPVPVSEAFAYITEISHWAEYWPDFVRIQNPATARWSEPGDMVTVVLRLLRRERALIMQLEQFGKDALVTYVSRQEGLPDVRHERYFRAVPGGFEYRLVVAFEPRRGLEGLFDRWLLKRAVAAALQKTIASLERVLLDRAHHGALR